MAQRLAAARNGSVRRVALAKAADLINILRIWRALCDSKVRQLGQLMAIAVAPKENDRKINPARS
jgi:hypothetical protein